MSAVRNLLKKILPIPTAGFMREINQINQKIDYNAKKRDEELFSLHSENKELKKNIIEMKDTLQSLHSENKHLQEQISKTETLLNELNRGILSLKLEPQRIIDNILHHIHNNSKTLIYTKEFEKNFYKNTFNKSVFENPGYEDRVLNLVKGLDDESIFIVSRNLRQMEAVMTYDKPQMSLMLYDNDEQTFINNEVSKFARSVIKLSDSAYYCNGYLLPSKQFEYCVFGDKHGTYKIDNMDYVYERNIIDVGACIGDSALVFSSMTREKVYSFEASSRNYDMMLKTIEMNNVENIVPINMALTSEEDITVNLNISDMYSACNISANDGLDYCGFEAVKATTLDSYVRENHLEVGLIKVDIEGAEKDFLKGAIQTIKEQKPVLIISIYHSADDFFDIKPMLEELNLGYRFKIHRPKIGSVLLETVLIAEFPR